MVADLLTINPLLHYIHNKYQIQGIGDSLSRDVELRNSPIPLTPKNGVRKRIKRNHYDEENL